MAICGGLFTANAVFRYASYRAEIGPEEEPDRKLLSMGLVNGMALCRKRGVIVWIPRVLAVLLWVGILLVQGFNLIFLLYGVTASLLLGLSYVDIRIHELPPALNAMIAVCGFIRLIMDLDHWYVYVIGAVAVSGLFLLIGLFSGGRAMGGGDVKLMAALGLLLGWQKILLVLLLGTVFGAVIHGARMLIAKDGHELAFGPYLAAGAAVAMLFGDRLIALYLSMVLAR